MIIICVNRVSWRIRNMQFGVKVCSTRIKCVENFFCGERIRNSRLFEVRLTRNPATSAWNSKQQNMEHFKIMERLILEFSTVRKFANWADEKTEILHTAYNSMFSKREFGILRVTIQNMYMNVSGSETHSYCGIFSVYDISQHLLTQPSKCKIAPSKYPQNHRLSKLMILDNICWLNIDQNSTLTNYEI